MEGRTGFGDPVTWRADASGLHGAQLRACGEAARRCQGAAHSAGAQRSCSTMARTLTCSRSWRRLGRCGARFPRARHDIRGTRGWVIEQVVGANDAALMARLLEQCIRRRRQTGQGQEYCKRLRPSAWTMLRTRRPRRPREGACFRRAVGERRPSRWLAESQRLASVHVPKRGPSTNRAVTENARQARPAPHESCAGDITARSRFTRRLAETSTQRAPAHRVAVPHTGGENQVASVVVFEDGMPRKDAYRAYSIPR